MGWVVLSARKQLLLQRISDYESQQMRIQNQLMDLHKYATSVSQHGYLSYNQMASMPSSADCLAKNYIARTHGNVLLQADEYTSGKVAEAIGQGLFDKMPNQECIDSTIDYWHEERMRTLFQEAARSERERVKCIEDELNQQLEQIKARLSATNKEYESIDQAMDAEIKRSTPKYA